MTFAVSTTPSCTSATHAAPRTFYREALGFEVVAEMGDGAAVFLQASGTENHHDLGLFSIGPDAPSTASPVASASITSRGRSTTIHDLADMRGPAGASSARSSARATTASASRCTRKDPDGNEFEVMWDVPREHWGRYAQDAAVLPLDLDAELARYA